MSAEEQRLSKLSVKELKVRATAAVATMLTFA